MSTKSKKTVAPGAAKAAAAAANTKTKTASINYGDLSLAISKTYNNYIATLTPRLKLIDMFLGFLVLLGILQFVYVIVVGDFPFNAFLGGFISCVAQFVLTVSLRLEINDTSANANSHVFGEYIFALVILHFMVFHFIN